MEVNWTLAIYIIIAFFAISGFFKGWWKETIITFFLGVLIFLLNTPEITQWIVEQLNSFKMDFLDPLFGFNPGSRETQIDGGSRNMWIIVLLVFVLLAALIGRSSLPNKRGRGKAFNTYPVTPLGGVLGGLLGALNGFLIINLFREYLDGRNLPTSNAPATEIAMAGSGSIGTVSSGVSIQAADVANFALLDNFLPWAVIGLGLLLLVAVLVSMRGDRVPFGYIKWGHKKEKDNFFAIPLLVKGK
ncbi:MAG: hypothetical protein GY796_17560 [Chloroflexi bacterium]|nr:hypothetical protein [Chloroflexota bacterium]